MLIYFKQGNYRYDLMGYRAYSNYRIKRYHLPIQPTSQQAHLFL